MSRSANHLIESKESEKEAKIIKSILATTVKQNDLFDFLLDKYELHKVLRVSAWITRFKRKAIGFNHNKAGLFEGSFSWGDGWQFDPPPPTSPPPSFIFQEELT